MAYIHAYVIKKKTFLWHFYWTGRVNDLYVYFMTGTPKAQPKHTHSFINTSRPNHLNGT